MGKHAQLIQESLAVVVEKRARRAHPEHWAKEHLLVWDRRPLVSMILACADYADQHEKRFESGIGEDGVLGKEWERMMNAIRGLLNGELGGLDGGTLDNLLCRMLEAEGFAV